MKYNFAIMGAGNIAQCMGDTVQRTDIVNGYAVASRDLSRARKLAEKYEVSMPIVEQINEVLFENKSAAQAVDELMLRESKSEHSVLPWPDETVLFFLIQENRAGIIPFVSA